MPTCRQRLYGKKNIEIAEVIESKTVFENITITRTTRKHGSSDILEHMGEVSGFVLQGENEPTLYIVGDSIWLEEVENVIGTYKLEIIVTNSGGAIILGFENNPILMNEEQTILLAQTAKKRKSYSYSFRKFRPLQSSKNLINTKSNRRNSFNYRTTTNFNIGKEFGSWI